MSGEGPAHETNVAAPVPSPEVTVSVEDAAPAPVSTLLGHAAANTADRKMR